MTKPDFATGLCQLKAAISTLPPVECRLLEFVAEGYYFRAIVIPKGTYLVGKKHRGPCRNLSFGDILVATEDGVKRLTGCHESFAPAGIQRGGCALEDTIWVCIHETSETDLLKMEALLTYPEGGEDDSVIPHSTVALPASNAAVKP
jgi:hypothetical protein